MQFTTSVTQKGQATIPASIRQQLGIKVNSKVIFEINHKKEVTLKPVPDFFAMKGSIKSDKPFDIAAMEKTVGEAIKIKYVKKLT